MEWANSFFDVQLRVSASILGVEQDPDVVFAYAEYLAKLPYPQLVALAELTGACKSLLIGFALAEGIVSHEQVRRRWACWCSLGVLVCGRGHVSAAPHSACMMRMRVHLPACAASLALLDRCVHAAAAKMLSGQVRRCRQLIPDSSLHITQA